MGTSDSWCNINIRVLNVVFRAELPQASGNEEWFKSGVMFWEFFISSGLSRYKLKTNPITLKPEPKVTDK